MSTTELYAVSPIETLYGTFECHVFRDEMGAEHVVMAKGHLYGEENVLCRVHSECLTGEVFGSLHCDCREQLALALERIQQEGRGVLVYMRQEGRGIGLGNKIRAYAKQHHEGLDTVDANLALGLPEDARNYQAAADIVRFLGIKSVVLMTNNPAKVKGLEKAGLIVARLEHKPKVAAKAQNYLSVKKSKMGHML